jgi:gas vesicle protein
MAEILRFIKQGSLKNLDTQFLQNFKKLKNPRFYIIALKKFIDNLFYDQDALKDAFNRWKNIINEENLKYIKSKLLYAIYRNHKEDKLRNIILKYKDQNAKDILKENNDEYPEDIKQLLEHYFHIWKNILPSDLKEILDGEKIVIAKNQMKQFKKDKYKDQIEEFERRIKEEEEALKRKYELKDNDLIIMDQKGNIVDIREWRNDPLKRVIVIRYRQ